jgi:hypothetical protein
MARDSGASICDCCNSARTLSRESDIKIGSNIDDMQYSDRMLIHNPQVGRAVSAPIGRQLSCYIGETVLESSLTAGAALLSADVIYITMNHITCRGVGRRPFAYYDWLISE